MLESVRTRVREGLMFKAWHSHWLELSIGFKRSRFALAGQRLISQRQTTRAQSLEMEGSVENLHSQVQELHRLLQAERAESDYARTQLALALSAAMMAKNVAESARRDSKMYELYNESGLLRLRAEVGHLRDEMAQMHKDILTVMESRAGTHNPYMDVAESKAVVQRVHSQELVRNVAHVDNVESKIATWIRESIASAQGGLNLFMDSHSCRFPRCVVRDSDRHEHVCAHLCVFQWESHKWPGRIELVNDLQFRIPTEILLAHPALDKVPRGGIPRLVNQMEWSPLSIQCLDASDAKAQLACKVWHKMESHVLVCWNIDGIADYPWANWSWMPKDSMIGRFECQERSMGSSCARFQGVPCSRLCYATESHGVLPRRGKAKQLADDSLRAHNVLNEQKVIMKGFH